MPDWRSLLVSSSRAASPRRGLPRRLVDARMFANQLPSNGSSSPPNAEVDPDHRRQQRDRRRTGATLCATRYPSGARRPRSEPARRYRGRLPTRGAYVTLRKVDVTDRLAMTDWISGVDRETPLDLVIANAGTAGRHLPDGPERIRAIFAVNLDGVLNTIEPAEAAMVRRGSGHLALMSSVASFYGSPNSAAYCSSKAAVRLLGEGLRQPLARNGIADLGDLSRIRPNANERRRPPSPAAHDECRSSGGHHRARSGARQVAHRLPVRHLHGRSPARRPAPHPGQPADGAPSAEGIAAALSLWSRASPVPASRRVGARYS